METEAAKKIPAAGSALARWRVPLPELVNAVLGRSREDRAGVSRELPYALSPIGNSTCLIPPAPSSTV